MDSKVILYDSHNNKIGETYARRARQLVKQQRASWVDESGGAIRFAPGMENMDDAVADDMREKHMDKELMRLARRRVHARFGFRLHSLIALAVCVFLIMLYMLTDMGGYFWPIWPMLGLGLSVVIHGIVYKTVFGDDMNSKITREYEMLRHQHLFMDYDDKRS